MEYAVYRVRGAATAFHRTVEAVATSYHGRQVLIAATMTQDNAPLRVLKISELTRAIASQLVSYRRRGAACLARTCRYLEEPALSALWETQQSLFTLLKVLPKGNWRIDGTGQDRTVRGLGFPVEKLNAQAWS